APGTYTIALTVSGDGGSETLTKQDYITVFEPAMANFSASPTDGLAPLPVDFTNLSSGAYDTCLWDFGDGATNDACDDPSHVYTMAGSYTVKLTVMGPFGGHIKMMP